ncbi:MAG: hypothetical protein BGP04_16750 [Rhizobiales bacterium 62-17]|mgnify:CR=1 FL=1|nr:2Fe-2S iron-sulfur cluster binding domain-containing protein [Hyphomicrobiales bacterium]OJY03385.1 MAG: hypothetical protein BGP04_16750 [Rhizobiales bacterium 62-17]
MPKRVRIEQFDQDIVVEDGETILQSALDAGLDYPFMCQQGQCGACKAQLISGSVDLGSYYNPLVLTEEDRAQGQILACQAEPLSDCVISIGVVDGEMSHVQRDLDYEVVSLSSTADIMILRLQSASTEPFHFSAGQNARLSHSGSVVETGMVNRPDDKILEFHIPIIADNASCGLSAGAIVRVEGPFGNGYLRDEHLGPILLIGFGAECGRLLAIAETALRSGMTQQISLFLDVSAQDLAPRRLSDLQSSYRNFRTYQIDGTPRIADVQRMIKETFGDLDGFHVYLGGALELCIAMREMLAAEGLTPEDCHFNSAEPR